jgi:hypothetical protein
MDSTDRDKLSLMASEKPAGDVLAQPTRARLFAPLAGPGRPAGTDELELHPSGARVHLERLRRAGLVSRERAPPDRGRPRDTWRLAPDAVPGDEPPDADRKLARWLARSIPCRPARLREVERSGQELGRELLPDGSRSAPAETMGRTLTALGFGPNVNGRRPDGLSSSGCAAVGTARRLARTRRSCARFTAV